MLCMVYGVCAWMHTSEIANACLREHECVFVCVYETVCVYVCVSVCVCVCQIFPAMLRCRQKSLRAEFRRHRYTHTHTHTHTCLYLYRTLDTKIKHQNPTNTRTHDSYIHTRAHTILSLCTIRGYPHTTPVSSIYAFCPHARVFSHRDSHNYAPTHTHAPIHRCRRGCLSASK